MRAVLFIIESDPRLNRRAAEAVRIAAGLCAWQRVRVTVVFAGAAILALNADTIDLVDSDAFRNYLSGPERSGGLYAAADTRELETLATSPWIWSAVNSDALAAMSASHIAVLHF